MASVVIQLYILLALATVHDMGDNGSPFDGMNRIYCLELCIAAISIAQVGLYLPAV